MKNSKQKDFDKETVGLAGEYAVASELCRRGHYCQLTLGHHKKTDILVEFRSNSTGAVFGRVSVKSKKGSAWPKVTGISETGDLIIFVDFKNKLADAKPDFYILDVDAWKSVIRLKQKALKDSKIDNKTNTVYWDPWKGNDKGWRGCAIRIEDIKKYKEQWENVTKR